MKNKPEAEHDTIAWFRVGLVVTSALIGLVLHFSDIRPAAFFFLGYALIVAPVMLVFKTWRSSSEVEKATRSHWKRMIRNLPRGIFRLLLGHVVFIIVIAVGLIPTFFISTDFYYEHEQLLKVYSYFLVAISFVVCFWVAGLFNLIRQGFSDFKEIREAVNKAKERRAKQRFTEKH